MTYHYSSPWTDERVERLKVLVAEELSATRIADALNTIFHIGLSRNSIIGKCSRLGLHLSPKSRWSDKSKSETIKPKPITPKHGPVRHTPFRKPKPKPEVDVGLKPDQSSCAVTLEQLASYHSWQHCRWPIDQPTGPMMYCGARPVVMTTATGVKCLPYCSRHSRIAYNAPPARKPQSYWVGRAA